MSQYISITFDTEGIINNYPEPSQNQDLPTPIASSFCYLIASMSSSAGNGTDKLKLYLNIGSMIRIYGCSASNNFDDAALLYDISRSGGRRVFENFNPLTLMTDSLIPTRQAPLDTELVENVQFLFMESQVLEYGKETENISFALYKRNDLGQPALFGYYQFSETFKVKALD